MVVGAKRSDDQGSDSGSVYVFGAVSGAQVHELLPADGAGIGTFGEAVGVSDGVVAVGAHGASANGPLSGAAYLFDAQSGVQLFKLLPDDGATNDFFGASIAIDGDVVVVGASYKHHAGKHSGAAYLFDASTGAQVAKLVPDDPAPFDRFGNAVAVGGGRVLVGAFQETENGFAAGSAYVFDLAGSQTSKLLAPDGAPSDDFGWAVAAGRVRLAVGAVGDADLGRDSGSVYLFD